MSSPKKKDLLASGLSQLRSRSGQTRADGGFMAVLAAEIAEEEKAGQSPARAKMPLPDLAAKPKRSPVSESPRAFKQPPSMSPAQFATIIRDKPKQVDWLALGRISKGARRTLAFLSSQRLGPGIEPQLLPPQVLKLGLGVKAANTTPPLCLPTLAQQVGLKERAVQYCIEKLTEVGAVRRIGWSQNAREYGQRGMVYEVCLSVKEVAEYSR